MTKPLTTKQVERAGALLATLNEPIDLGFPVLSKRDAVLCARRLLNLSPAAAAQLVAAHRGEVFDDMVVVDDAGACHTRSKQYQNHIRRALS